MDDLIITAAITGGRPMDEGSPHRPRTPEAIAEAAVRACEAGAAIVHIHARDDDGVPIQDPAIYRRILEPIRARCDAILNLTTSGRIGLAPEERMRPLELRPELASFDAGSLNFGDTVFLNPPDFLRELAARMRRSGTKPELEVFDLGMLETCLALAREGLLEPPLHVQFVLGVRGGAPANAGTLIHLVAMLPPGATWSVTGIGRAQVPMALLALATGGHVRVGLEDTAYYARGVPAESNEQLVARIVRLAQEAGRAVATPRQARIILGLERA